MAKIRKMLAYPEIWGGIECTISRCHDIYRDQLHLSNHYARQGDLEAFAALGIKSIRYPILWEKHTADQNGVTDWTWSSGQLLKLQNLGIEPIAGLLHHGSGPSSTSLIDKDFPRKLAKYAGKVAAQFPWIKYYTPVNEPLTTARFAGLYGFWYPHLKDGFHFLTMLLNQLEGTVLSMKAIREINPDAKLVQTEDIGKTHSTPMLKYQADFENHRRWITYDLLCGRVNNSHPLWNYFIENGIDPERLEFFTKAPCPPDIAGFNYYATSERFLDEAIDKYPLCLRGSNGRHEYADNVAVRVVRPAGIGNLLTEAWERYHLPMAVTEAHLNCTREDQLRWFKEIWDQCCGLLKKDIDIRAVTAWSLLGAYDWDSLLVNQAGHYETGVFDISSDIRRPTAMVKLIQSLNSSGTYNHPLLENKGWWHRHNPAASAIEKLPVKSAPVLILGNGSLAKALTIACDHRGIPYQILTRTEIDITDRISIEKVLDIYKPWAVINATGFINLDTAESKVNECYAVNTLAPAILADACKTKGLIFLTFSTDMVFNGNKRAPYLESDEIVPVNVYGKSKAKGEEAALGAYPQALIIRTSSFFGPLDKNNFVFDVMNSLEQHGSYQAVNDIIVSPTYLPDLVQGSLDLLIDEATGIWHLSNDGNLTWSDFAKEIAQRRGYSRDRIMSKRAADMNWKAMRPHYSVLESEKGIRLPTLNNAIERYFSGPQLPFSKRVPALV